MTSAVQSARPGRSCPPSYGYSPAALARPAEFATEVMYVVGGLYGNEAALAEIERMAACEGTTVRIVFNGDFHWFDASPKSFLAITEGVARHTALRGNVETEIAAADEENGCGCAYPESVPDDDVARSNAILGELRRTARTAEHHVPGLVNRLALLPMHAIATVNGARIAIVHGDAWALAGWGFAHDELHGSDEHERLRSAFEHAAVDGFASSHTCLPALKTLDTPLGERFVINNGAAGMPNFRGTRYGLITRVATVPVPGALSSERIYGADIADLYVDALAVRFNADAWQRQFDSIWPRGSAAAISYRRRIVDGPDFSIANALGRTAAAASIAQAA